MWYVLTVFLESVHVPETDIEKKRKKKDCEGLEIKKDLKKIHGMLCLLLLPLLRKPTMCLDAFNGKTIFI
jgi:hypothetical protein